MNPFKGRHFQRDIILWRTTPSVAEQEGQLIETEATGAPQKHHHTLNQ
ncbi:hypothetical protein [Klebsiella pneumoniae]